MLGADGSMYVCGENALDPFHFALKSPDIDDTSQLPGGLPPQSNSSQRHEDFSKPRTTARTPVMLQLPAPMRSIR